MVAIQHALRGRRPAVSIRHAIAGSPRRAAAEEFISATFRRQYGAELHTFAPNLVLLESGERILAAAGWRGAGDGPLFLESYLDVPIERALARVSGHPVRREHIVEVGHLAAARRGASLDIIPWLAEHLDRLGFEWVVCTATRELIGLFRRLALPPLALAPADPDRLGAQARDWGSYYKREPVVVAGPIRPALPMAKRGG